MDDNLNQAVIGDYLNIGHWSTRGLVGYWPFARAENLIDFTPTRRHGTIVGATWIGGGLSFNGTSDRVNVDITGLSLTEPFTMICLFQMPNTGVDDMLMAVANSSVGDKQHRLIASGTNVGGVATIHASTFDGTLSDAESTVEYTANKLHQAVAVYESASLRLAYLDGAAVGINTDTRNVTGINRLSFGITADSSPSGWLSGNLYTALLYNRALSASEIMQLYMNPNLPIQREPIWWGQAAAVVGVNPKGPLGHPLYGPFAGPIAV